MIPNIKASISSGLFIKAPIDALIFGVLIGYFSCQKEIKLNDETIEQMVTNYFTCAKKFHDLDLLLKELAKTNAGFLLNGSEGNVGNNNKDKYDNINGDNYDINYFKGGNKNNNNGKKDNDGFLLFENENEKNIDNHLDNNLKNNNVIIGEKDYVYNEEDFNDHEIPVSLDKCKICLDDFNILDSTNYSLNCNCIIHYTCFDQHVASAVRSNQLPVKCPICDVEVNAVFVYDSLNQTNPDLVAKYDKYTLNMFAMNNAKDTSCCPTAGCDYMFFYVAGQHRFFCPKCKKHYCLNCKTIWHYKRSCEQYRQIHFNEEFLDKRFLKCVIGNNFKKCIRCEMWVEKNEGCDHMRCRCGAEFCYRCGNIYHPNSPCQAFRPIPNPNHIPNGVKLRLKESNSTFKNNKAVNKKNSKYVSKLLSKAKHH